MSDPAVEALQRLTQLWRQELDATREAELAARKAVPVEARLRSGDVLDGLRFHHREAAKWDRGASGRAQQTARREVLVWLCSATGGRLGEHRFRVGYPLILQPATPSGRASAASEELPLEHESTAPDTTAPDTTAPNTIARGTIARWTATQLCVRLPLRYPSFVDSVVLRAEQGNSEATFQRGDAALRAFTTEPRLEAARALLFGSAKPSFTPSLPRALSFRDSGLNPSQQEAVTFAMRAKQIALIHGPPGTGKTRTLIEIVRQALLRNQRILVSAPSHAAVDNLAERLVQSGVRTLRLGKPGRVAPGLFEQTLGYQLTQTEEKAQGDALMEQANLQAERAAKSGSADLRRKSGSLRSQARVLLNAARAKVLRRARVVCCTAAGVDAIPLGDERFDMVLLDEASQAPDPVALATLQRGGILVLAGDHRQLPPTIVSTEAAEAGLATTLFERRAEAWGEHGSRLLTVQYRMHEALMRFPSESMYDGKLEADPGNREHRLEDLPGVRADPERPAPWLFLDTSGLDAANSEVASSKVGKQDARTPGETSVESSYANPRQAAITAAEVRRLLARGVAPEQIAAITPYSGQVALLKQLLADVATRLEIGSVDGFQGREKEAVVLDLVRSNERQQIGFLRDVRRTNVAITRAKRFLVIVGDTNTLGGHAYYAALIAAAKQAGVLLEALASDSAPRAD